MIAILAAVIGLAAPPPPNLLAPALDRQEAVENLRQAAALVRAEHAAPFSHIDEKEWAAVVEAEIDGLPAFVSLLELHRRLSRITAALGCAHSFVNPSEAFAATLAAGASAFPLSVTVIGGRPFLAEGPEAGTEIVSINGRPASVVLARMAAGVRIDGFGEDRKAQELARRFAYHYATQIDPRPEVFEVRTADGRTLRLAPDAGLPLPGGGDEDFLSVTRRADGVVILRIAGFYDRDRDQQFADFLADAGAALEGEDVRAAIIDLRGNPGGVDAYGVATLALLASSPFVVYERIEATADFKRDGYTVATDDEGRRLVSGADGQELTAPTGSGVTGPLVVLIDQRTGSTAADVASHLDAFEDAILVGEETTGAYNANSSGFLDVHVLAHSGAQLYLPRWRYQTAAARSDRRHRGVLPDIPVGRMPPGVGGDEDRALRTALSLAVGG